MGESATPDSKENKQANAGSRRFRRHFLCGALCNFLSTEHEVLSTHVQNEWEENTTGMFSRTFYAQYSVTNKSSHLAPVLAYDFLSGCELSTPISTLLNSSIIRLYPQNPVIVHESVKIVKHSSKQNGHSMTMYGDDCDGAIAKAAAAVTHVQSQSQKVGSGDGRAGLVVF